jgi:hypothetical protein
MAPALVAVGAVAALANNYTLLPEARHPHEDRSCVL